MRIDLSCPAETAGAELNRGEDSWVRLILLNLTDREIDSCEATVRFLDREGGEAGRTVHRARALHGKAHSAFSMGIPAEIPEKAERAEATLDKIWFEDRDVWRRNPAAEKEYEPNRLPPGNELNALKYAAGQDAVGFPRQEADMWLCVCGRPNSNRDSACVRCGRPKTMVFQQFRREPVLRLVSQRERQLDLQTRGAREEAAQLQRVREQEYERRQRRRGRIRRAMTALCCALALAAAGYFLGEPALRLLSADAALRENRLEDARDLLRGLGSFPGAEKRLTEAEKRIARRDGEQAARDAGLFSQERMRELTELLRSRGDQPEDGALADRVQLSLAESLLADGDFAGAERELAELPEETEGRAGLAEDCTFARAQAALQKNDYETARTLYLSLGEYAGAAEGAKQASYEQALSQMEAGKYDEAVQTLETIPGYLDSGELIPRCRYLKGFTLESAGEAEAARQAYLAAGEYEDARERALAIRWNQAEAFFAAEDYESALPLYRELDGYGEAREKWTACAAELARSAYRQREYALAASWLEDLPEQTRDTGRILTRAYYLGAKAAAARGELEEAVAMMEKVPDYSDAGKNIRNWRMTLAQRKADEGLYAEALELLRPVESHYNAQKLIREIEKKLEEAKPEEEKPEEAKQAEEAKPEEEKPAEETKPEEEAGTAEQPKD